MITELPSSFSSAEPVARNCVAQRDPVGSASPEAARHGQRGIESPSPVFQFVLCWPAASGRMGGHSARVGLLVQELLDVYLPSTQRNHTRTHLIDGWPKPHHHFRVGRSHPGTGKVRKKVWVGSLSFPFAVRLHLSFFLLSGAACPLNCSSLSRNGKRTGRRLDLACRNFDP